MAGREVRGRPTDFGLGWDRQDPWTLRFIDPVLERAYREATAQPARQRVLSVGIVLWLSAAILGPPFLGLPAASAYAAAGIATVWLLGAVLVTLRALTLPQVWAIAFSTTIVSAFRPLGTPDLKGKSVATAVYELLDVREAAASTIAV